MKWGKTNPTFWGQAEDELGVFLLIYKEIFPLY